VRHEPEGEPVKAQLNTDRPSPSPAPSASARRSAACPRDSAHRQPGQVGRVRDMKRPRRAWPGGVWCSGCRRGRLFCDERGDNGVSIAGLAARGLAGCGYGAVGEQRVARVAVIRCRGCQAAQVARRRTSQMVLAMSSADSASSQPLSIHWNGQNRLARELYDVEPSGGPAAGRSQPGAPGSRQPVPACAAERPAVRPPAHRGPARRRIADLPPISRRRRNPGRADAVPGFGEAGRVDATGGSDLNPAAGSGTLDRRGRRHARRTGRRQMNRPDQRQPRA